MINDCKEGKTTSKEERVEQKEKRLRREHEEMSTFLAEGCRGIRERNEEE